MSGPPGPGKTMLARRLPGIVSPLARKESIDATKVHSAAGEGGGALETASARLSVAQDAAAGAEPMPVELPEKEAAAFAGVGFEPARVDVVARRVADLAGGVEVCELLSALALLELKGYVIRDASGAFARNPIGDSSANHRGVRW